jgi:two-component system cell cycle sensor histidine kinase/response regulator CckA
MSGYSVPVVVAGGISAYVGLYYFLLYLRRALRSDLFFALSCLCMTFYDGAAAFAYNASTFESAEHFQRLQVIGILMWGAPFIALVNEKSSIRTTKLGAGMLSFFPMGAVFVALDPFDWLLMDRYRLKRVEAPWGTAEFMEVEPGPLQHVLEFMIPAMIVYCFWAGLGAPGLKGGNIHREKSHALLLTATAIFVSLLHDATVTGLGIHRPYIFEFAWLGIMTFMSWSLSNEVFEGIAAQNTLLLTEQRVATTLNAIQDAVVTTDLAGNITHLNSAAERLLAVTLREARMQPFSEYAEVTSPETHNVVSDPIRFAVGRPTNPYGELPQLVTTDGSERRVDLGGAPLKDPSGRVTGAIVVLRDLTLQHHALGALEHANKMESIGQLAGGTAHDLNNLLTPIMSYVELVQRKTPETSTEYRYLTHVQEAARKAAILTKQLLALSRKQVLDVQIVPIAEFVRQTLPLVERLMGEKIKLITRLDEHAGNAQIDLGQFEQVFLNLASNARDAMPDGGRLTIAVRALSGSEISIEIADTGEGMYPETVSHIFEPFFTTKKRGKGTGLGLASVRGIVEQHGGTIFVDSEPGEGTSFEIVLPSTTGKQPSSGARDIPPSQLLRGSERVLVVEDDAAVRSLIFDALTQLGYTVHTADGITMAIALAESETIDLLLSDVVLPGTDGLAIRAAVTKHHDVPCLFMTGHADDRLGTHGFVPRGLDILRKPFTVEELGRKIRQVLDTPKRKP